MYIFIYLINYKRKPRFATNFKIEKKTSFQVDKIN